MYACICGNEILSVGVNCETFLFSPKLHLAIVSGKPHKYSTSWCLFIESKRITRHTVLRRYASTHDINLSPLFYFGCLTGENTTHAHCFYFASLWILSHFDCESAKMLEKSTFLFRIMFLSADMQKRTFEIGTLSTESVRIRTYIS